MLREPEALLDQVLKLDNVSFRYRRSEQWINHNVTLAVKAGEIVALLGPNGAGKTTLIRQILGLEAPNSGSIQLVGRPIRPDMPEITDLCAYLPQQALPTSELRVEEALHIFGQLAGMPRASAQAAAEREIAYWRLAPLLGRQIRHLSGGQKRLVAIAIALLAPRPLIILDEPSNDLAPDARVILWQRIRELAAGGSAILLVTHNISEVEDLVSRACILINGELVTNLSRQDFLARDRVYLYVPNDVMESVSDLAVCEPHGPNYTVETCKLLEAYQRIHAAGSDAALAQVRMQSRSLESIYLAAIGGR